MRRMIAAVVLLAPLGLTGAGCAVGAEQPVGPAPVPLYNSTAPDTVWPLRLSTSSGSLDIYQPQPEKLEGDKLTARAAVSITPPGATDPVFGAIWMQARVATDRDTRTVTIVDVDVRRVRFPDSQQAQEQQLEQIIEQELPRLNVTFPLDELMTSLDAAEKEREATSQLQTAPPKIIFTTTPATLITIDGPPKLQQSQQPGVMQVVNTPFILLFDLPSKRYYLKAGDTWMSAADVTGPWGNAAAVPATVAAEAQALTPPPDPNAPQAAPLPPPGPPGEIIISEEPAELISTDGEAQYTPIIGNELLYVSNTQSDVFMEVATQQIYVLLSGRWYRAPSLRGPWEYVPSDKLPAAFSRIPPNSPKANVLASVAGTPEAKDARLDAAVPQTAAISRDAGSSLDVTYDGEPQFDPIQQTPVSYCVNTPEAVLLVNHRYYCCHQAVWYQASVARGPWTVCVSVPQVIYTIPPSCPVYHVRYVYVYDYTPTVVYCGYLPGYVGCFRYGPTVVFGTGYVYPAWYRTVYIPRPRTWGFGVRYDVVAATWADGAGYRWDRRWFVGGGRHEEWFGPRGFVDYHRLPHVGEPHREAAPVRLNVNIYRRSENARRNVSFGRTEADRNAPQRKTRVPATPPARESRQPARAPVARPPNNVYAGRDGTVYRRTDQGWEQRGGNRWSRIDRVPEAPAASPARPEQRPAEQRPAPRPAEPQRNERPVQPAPQRQPAERAPARPEPRQPQRSPEPAREPGGLEADHAARERGADRARSFGGPPPESGGSRGAGGGRRGR